MKTIHLFTAAGTARTICAALFAGALLLGSSAFAQVKIGTNPTVINAANNLEVEASTAGRRTSIDKTTGKVTIADGTQGVDKILTSDVNGVATWQSPTSVKIPQTVFTAYYTTPTTVVNTTTAGSVRVPFTVTNPSAGWDATNREYTIPSAGIYRIEYNTRLDNTNSSPGKTFYNQYLALTATGRNSTYQINGGSYAWGPSVFITSAFSGGEKVFVSIISYDPASLPMADTIWLFNGSLVVTKIE